MFRKYSVSVGSDSNVIISHISEDKDAFKFLENNLKEGAVIKVFEALEGVDASHISSRKHQWIIKNYEGLKQLLINFCDTKKFKIYPNVLSQLK